MVGRDEEVDLLQRRWARANAGDGQVVLISGEPGIGKSRLVAALAERLRGEPHLRLRYFCSPYSQNSALFPFVDQLSRASGLARDDTPAAKLAKLEALLTRAAPEDEDVALLADLLSLPSSERYPPPNLSPQRKKDRTLEALLRQLEGLAHQHPVVMVVEDAHWIDPTSLELLDLTVERVGSLRVLLIVTSVLESGLLRDEKGRYVLDSTLSRFAIPMSLQDSLMARLDRLASVRLVAQIGAAIGREFSYALLHTVARLPEQELQMALARLVASELVFQRGTPPEAVYIFKHALVQDTAHGSLLRGSRQQLHVQIAEALETRSPDLMDTQPELFAQHYAEAGLVEKSVAC